MWVLQKVLQNPNIIKLTWSERRKIKKIVEKFSLDWTIKKGKHNGI